MGSCSGVGPRGSRCPRHMPGGKVRIRLTVSLIVEMRNGAPCRFLSTVEKLARQVMVTDGDVGSRLRSRPLLLAGRCQ